MAEIYSPWQFSGEESMLEEGLATKTYQEQADEIEDMVEGEQSEADNPMKEHMAAALETIQQQSTTIKQLTAMLSGTTSNE